MDAITQVPLPLNESVNDYAPGSPERARLVRELDTLAANPLDIRQVIDGQHRTAAGPAYDVVQPHRHASVIGRYTEVTRADVADAVEAANRAAAGWRDLPFDARAAVFLRAADLLAGPWRERVAAATMLGQSKTAYQAEIDTPCELIDFWRFNVAYARQILADQPISSPGIWNRVEYRPLEGFVYAITPFNFSAIAGNLPTAPALMGNTVVWKAAPTQAAAAYADHAAAGGGRAAGRRDQHGVRATARSSPRSCWQRPASWPASTSPGRPRSSSSLWSAGRQQALHLPRLPAAGRRDRRQGLHRRPQPPPIPEVLTTALIRGAFEFQGQKCSAASRAFVPASVWARKGDDFLRQGRRAPLRRRHRLHQLRRRRHRSDAPSTATRPLSTGPRPRTA